MLLDKKGVLRYLWFQHIAGTAPMIARSFISRAVRKLISNNKAFILQEVLAVRGLMQLLMKYQNTGQTWTAEEKREIRKHLRNISKMVPVIIIFLLPGGTVLLPVLGEVLDRRKKRRSPLP
jgi:hypothetical protein